MHSRSDKKIYHITLSALCMALGLVLPFLTGQIPEIGNMLLPMHLPIFLCGILCGIPYGAIVGLATPLLRSLIFQRPILYPTALSMAFELCAYGVLVALFVKLFRKKSAVTLYLSLLGAMLGGRLVWAITRVILLSLGDMPFSFEIFLTEGFVTALPGILVQFLLIPPLVIAIDSEYRRAFLKKKQLAVAKYTTADAANAIAEAILTKNSPQKQLTVAIEGRAASGKTTLAASLSEALTGHGISHIVAHTDDYLLPFDQRTPERMDKVGGHFDWARMKEEVLTPHLQKAPLTYRRFSCRTASFEEGVTYPSASVLIVEGAYSMHPELFTGYDVTVFCEVDRAKQKERVTARDGERASAFFTEWIPREERYFAALRPDLSVDFRIVMNR